MAEFPRILIADLGRVLDGAVLQGEVVGTIIAGSPPQQRQGNDGPFTSARMVLRDETGTVTCWVNKPEFDPTMYKGQAVAIRPKLNGKNQWSGAKKKMGREYQGKSLPELTVYGDCARVDRPANAGEQAVVDAFRGQTQVERDADAIFGPPPQPTQQTADFLRAERPPSAPPPGKSYHLPYGAPSAASTAPRTDDLPAPRTLQPGREVMSLPAAEGLFLGIYGRTLRAIEGLGDSALSTVIPGEEYMARAQAMATTLMIAILDGRLSVPEEKEPGDDDF